VTYKRVSTGEGPGTAVILPVDPEKAEEDLAKLMVQMNLPNKNTKISRSWAQTQFLAEHDPHLHLTGSPQPNSRQSYSSSGMRSIDTIGPIRSNHNLLNGFPPFLNADDYNKISHEQVHTFSDTLHDGNSSMGGDDSGMSQLAKHMMDEWQPPAIFSKKPETPKMHAKIVRAQPNNWALVAENEMQEKDSTNNIMLGDNNRDMEILNYYNQRAATADAASTDNRHARHSRNLKSAPSKQDSKFYDRLLTKSNRSVFNSCILLKRSNIHH